MAERRGEQDGNRLVAAVRRPLVALGIAVLAVPIGRAVLEAPRRAEGLGPEVSEQLGRAGATNPVTAVLLNFRGYDTMLELLVLLVALLALPATVRPPRARGPWRSEPTGAVLQLFVQVLTPLVVIVGAYLLWAGSKAPGGAFPAGAVLAAAGVLLSLSRFPGGVAVGGPSARGAIVAGLAIFMLVGAAPLAVGRALLEYPVDWAGGLILLVEAASTISIAAILALLFGGRPPLDDAATLDARKELR